MKKCLITKLSATVDNNELLKVGEEIINFNNTTGNTISFIIAPVTGESITVSVIGSGTINGSTNPVTVSSETTLTLSSDVSKLKVTNKYNIKKIRTERIATSEPLHYMNNLTELHVNNCIFNLSDIYNKENMYYIHIYFGLPGSTGSLNGLSVTGVCEIYSDTVNNPDITGDLSTMSFKKDMVITSLPGITGDISDINITPYGGVTVLYTLRDCPNVTGTIEEFLTRFTDRYKGTNKNIKINVTNTQVTYNGTVPTRLLTFTCAADGTWSAS